MVSTPPSDRKVFRGRQGKAERGQNWGGENSGRIRPGRWQGWWQRLGEGRGKERGGRTGWDSRRIRPRRGRMEAEAAG